MADKTVRGRFVWHELITPDTAGAHGFYSKVLGWKTQAWEQDPSYSMFAAASGPLGGSVAQTAGTPHWLGYIATDDIDATVQKATSLGGSVHKEITTMPTGSKYAELADPQGAKFGVYWSAAADNRGSGPAKRGEFSWNELAASDYQAAFEFYSALFGWDDIAEREIGPLGKYLIFGRNGAQLGGIFNKTAQMHGPPFWLGYVRVKDVNQSVKKIKSARGTLINGPMEVPGGDWIAQFLDPYGAMFAVHAVAADMKSAAGAAPAASAAEATAAERAAPKKAAAKPAAKKPAVKKTAAKKPAAKRPAAKKSAARKKAAPKKKAAPRKKAAAKKTRAAAKSARRPARKAAKKKKTTTRQRSSSGGKKKAAKKPRKGK